MKDRDLTIDWDRYRAKVIYTSVIIRDFWTVTFEHTDLRFSAHSSLRWRNSVSWSVLSQDPLLWHLSLYALYRANSMADRLSLVSTFLYIVCPLEKKVRSLAGEQSMRRRWRSDWPAIVQIMALRRVGGLGGHEPHISDLRTPLFAKLTSEPHIAAPNPT